MSKNSSNSPPQTETGKSSTNEKRPDNKRDESKSAHHRHQHDDDIQRSVDQCTPPATHANDDDIQQSVDKCAPPATHTNDNDESKCHSPTPLPSIFAGGLLLPHFQSMSKTSLIGLFQSRIIAARCDLMEANHLMNHPSSKVLGNYRHKAEIAKSTLALYEDHLRQVELADGSLFLDAEEDAATLTKEVRALRRMLEKLIADASGKVERGEEEGDGGEDEEAEGENNEAAEGEEKERAEEKDDEATEDRGDGEAVEQAGKTPQTDLESFFEKATTPSTPTRKRELSAPCASSPWGDELGNDESVQFRKRKRSQSLHSEKRRPLPRSAKRDRPESAIPDSPTNAKRRKRGRLSPLPE